MKILPISFFDRPTLDVAHDLIGCYLVRKIGDKLERFQITETEAYDGIKDLASHSSKGKTKRTEIMFGPAGHMYIYFVYGIHWMLNIVTGPIDYPAAILIRGISDLNGPAILTKKLNITGALNGLKLSKKVGLWIEGHDKEILEKLIEKTARIGVDYAGPIWAKKKYRFILKSNSQTAKTR